jgi:phosphate transport system substrate-binding protein
MNAVVKKLALAVGMLVLVSCTITPKTSTSTQSSPTATADSDFEIVPTIKIDGSSTVFPITNAIAKEYQADPEVKAQVLVNISGTSGGFEKFCTGQTDISNASRPISKKEIEVCKKNNIHYVEIPVAFDALSVVINPENDWSKDITVAELKAMWEPAAEGKITRWNQVRASWPDRPLKLFGAGEQSGTFDYFTEAIVGEAKASRKDYTGSEDDEVLADGISKDRDALGYFGYAYYKENKEKLKVLAIDSGKGPVEPSPEAVHKNIYKPLSRPLFIYVNPYTAEKRYVYQFVNFYLQKASKVSDSVGYVALPEEIYRIGVVHLNRGQVGTVFGGQSQFDLTIGQLLQKQKQF